MPARQADAGHRLLLPPGLARVLGRAGRALALLLPGRSSGPLQPAAPPASARQAGPPRARRRARRLACAAAAVAAAAGATWAILAWTAIGFGNGPLFLPGDPASRYAWTDDSAQPVGVVLPVINTGHQTAVIDAVTVQSGLHSTSARVLAIRTGLFARFPCMAVGPLRPSAAAAGAPRRALIPSVLAGCVRPALRPAVGTALPAGTNAMGFGGWPVTVAPWHARPGTALVVELAAPPPGRCWMVAAVQISYHLGARSYTSTSGPGILACTPGASA